MMYPSRRGENDNPGRKEGSYGEVDDIITAAHYLAQESYVDPQRIYLGGHSTGGTLALLVAESCTPFRCVFSFGPVADTAEYGQKNLPFDTSNRLEVELRAPIYWLQSIETPTFVFEGVNQPSNVDSLRSMSQACKNPMVHFFAVAHADHRSTLARINRLIAQKILKDDGSRTNIEFTDDEINRAVIYSQ
jgi:alpha/beta superfamily hydrolase